jgi:RNA recognition motif-containing protein
LNHYAKKREEELKKVDEFTSIRLDDLPEDIKPEEIQQYFGRFGEVTSIYLPFCIKTKSYKSFGFVRFLQKEDAENAVRTMHKSSLGRGRPISVQISNTKTYFSQDETHYAV